jgi:transketolase
MREPRAKGWKSLWNNKFAEYKKAFPEEAAEFERRTKGDLPANWAEFAAKAIAAINEKGETIATRKASQNAINALVPALPEFLGGSADLTGSNLTNWTGAHHVHAKKPGNYISYGVREFGMSHIMNGMALHGGLLPFGGTFLMFSEYARNALRMSALMKQRVIFVFTHDSIGLGEDGPNSSTGRTNNHVAFYPKYGYLASM